MGALMRHALRGHLPPERLAGLAIKTQHDVFVNGVRMRDSKNAFGLILGLWQGGIDLAGVDGGKDEHLVAPDDRRRAAVTGNGDLPLDVLVLAPSDGRLGGGGAAGGVWPAPLMPVAGLGFVEIGGEGSEGTAQQGSAEDKGCFHFKE